MLLKNWFVWGLDRGLTLALTVGWLSAHRRLAKLNDSAKVVLFFEICKYLERILLDLVRIAKICGNIGGEIAPTNSRNNTKNLSRHWKCRAQDAYSAGHRRAQNRWGGMSRYNPDEMDGGLMSEYDSDAMDKVNADWQSAEKKKEKREPDDSRTRQRGSG